MKQFNGLPHVDYVGAVETALGEFRELSTSIKTKPPEPDMDVGRLSAEAVHQQYELAAKAVAGMGEVVKEHIARLETTLQQCDADMRLIAEASAEIASKGKLVAAEIEHTNAIAAEIRATVGEFRRKVGGAAAIVLIACAAWWAPPAHAQAKTTDDRVAEQRYQGPSLLSLDKNLLALALRDYGMWREEHDRKTFPTDMPGIGEPYDPVTGNAIRNKEGR